MNHRSTSSIALIAFGWLALAGTSGGQATANGPYYATPSWDQTLPASTRFVVLANFGNAAVLDRETALVWERSPDATALPWAQARLACANKTIGGRKGWRVPSLPEMMSLVDPTQSNPALPVGHPFVAPTVGSPVGEDRNAWTATSVADDGQFAWQGDIIHGTSAEGQKIIPGFCAGGPPPFPTECAIYFAWCVRGGMNASQY